MRIAKSVIAAACIAAFAAPARANDTSAALAVSGLRFTHSNAIEMVSEDLFISLDAVKVRYVFRNKTSKPVTTHVAFPLPDLKADMQEDPLNIPDIDKPNFVDFKTAVDGAPIPLQIEQKAILKGRDITAELAARGAPINPLARDFSDKIAALPAADRAALLKAHYVDQDEADVGKGMAPYYRPEWDMKTNFYREQTFPPGKDVIVEHSYRPVVGGTVMALVSSPEVWKSEGPRYRRDYCTDATYEEAGRKLAAAFPNTQERWISYILKTGANWAGPIGAFRLVVDKGAPGNVVSFCGQGVKKIAPTQFEMRAVNFLPKDDLHIVILTPAS